jgi:hypothetical protein
MFSGFPTLHHYQKVMIIGERIRTSSAATFVAARIRKPLGQLLFQSLQAIWFRSKFEENHNAHELPLGAKHSYVVCVLM